MLWVFVCIWLIQYSFYSQNIVIWLMYLRRKDYSILQSTDQNNNTTKKEKKIKRIERRKGRGRLLLAASLLSCLTLSGGCSTFNNSPHTPYKLINTGFQIKVFEAPLLKTDGLARWKKGYCEIYLKKYPICLKHEIRHCIEGDWHDPNIPNGEDCN